MASFSDAVSGLDQIGVVVRDLDRVKDGMRTVFGIEPRSQSENHYAGSLYRGESIDATVGALFYDFFGVELEFLCPDGGENIWQDFLDQRGEGIHHVRFQVTDHDAALESMTDQGIEARQIGDSVRGGGVKYAYFDTTRLFGFFVETLNAAQSPAAPPGIARAGSGSAVP